MNEWEQTTDLCTSLTINNVLQSRVGKLLDAIREAGFDVEINVSGRARCDSLFNPRPGVVRVRCTRYQGHSDEHVGDSGEEEFSW